MTNLYNLTNEEVRYKMESYNVGLDTVAIILKDDEGIVEYKTAGDLNRLTELSLELDRMKEYANLDMTFGSRDLLEIKELEIEEKQKELDKLEEEIMLASIQKEITSIWSL